MYKYFRDRRDVLRGHTQFAEDQLQALEKTCGTDLLQSSPVQQSYIILQKAKLESQIRLTVYANSAIKKRQNRGETNYYLKNTLSEVAANKQRQTDKFSQWYLETFENEVQRAFDLFKGDEAKSV